MERNQVKAATVKINKTIKIISTKNIAETNILPSATNNVANTVGNKKRDQ